MLQEGLVDAAVLGGFAFGGAAAAGDSGGHLQDVVVAAGAGLGAGDCVLQAVQTARTGEGQERDRLAGADLNGAAGEAHGGELSDFAVQIFFEGELRKGGAAVGGHGEDPVAAIGEDGIACREGLGDEGGDLLQDGAEGAAIDVAEDLLHVQDFDGEHAAGEHFHAGELQQVVFEGDIADHTFDAQQLDRFGEGVIEAAFQIVFQGADFGAAAREAVLFGEQAFGIGEAAEEFEELKGLGDVIGGAGLKGAVDEFLLRHGGEHEDGRVLIGVGLAQALGQFDPVHAGHLDVQQEAIEYLVFPAGRSQGLLGAGNRYNLVACFGGNRGR